MRNVLNKGCLSGDINKRIDKPLQGNYTQETMLLIGMKSTSAVITTITCSAYKTGVKC